MSHMHFNAKYTIVAGVLAFLTVLLAYGCASDQGPSPTTEPTASAAPAKGRTQIWAENCARCHNMRPPDSYSDSEWELVAQHMRVRGYLTGAEHKSIVELLKAGN